MTARDRVIPGLENDRNRTENLLTRRLIAAGISVSRFVGDSSAVKNRPVLLSTNNMTTVRSLFTAMNVLMDLFITNKLKKL